MQSINIPMNSSLSPPLKNPGSAYDRDVHCAGSNEVRWHLGQETSLPHPCSNLRSFGSKCSVLKKVLMTLLGLFSPHSDSVLGELRPLAPSLCLWCHAMKIGKFSESKQIFKSERHELLFREHLQFSNTISHDLAQTANKGY